MDFRTAVKLIQQIYPKDIDPAERAAEAQLYKGLASAANNVAEEFFKGWNFKNISAEQTMDFVAMARNLPLV